MEVPMLVVSAGLIMLTGALVVLQTIYLLRNW
jgi:hypothetical protein